MEVEAGERVQSLMRPSREVVRSRGAEDDEGEKVRDVMGEV